MNEISINEEIGYWLEFEKTDTGFLLIDNIIWPFSSNNKEIPSSLNTLIIDNLNQFITNNFEETSFFQTQLDSWQLMIINISNNLYRGIVFSIKFPNTIEILKSILKNWKNEDEFRIWVKKFHGLRLDLPHLKYYQTENSSQIHLPPSWIINDKNFFSAIADSVIQNVSQITDLNIIYNLILKVVPSELSEIIRGLPGELD